MADRPRVLVIGAGIVGIACGFHLRLRGANVTLVDPEPPGSMTSSGNAGGLASTEVMPAGAPGTIWRIPGWLFDPLGPLSLRWRHIPAMLPWLQRFLRASERSEVERISKCLSTLLQPSMQDTKQLLGQAGLQSMITERGSITVYESEKGRQQDKLEWQTKQARGIVLEKLNTAEIKRMEPALHNVSCGYFTPQWGNATDPLKLCQALASHLQSMGVKIIRDRVNGFRAGDPLQPVLQHTTIAGWDNVVLAAGVWSASLCHQLGETVILESERGYNTTLPDPGISLHRQVIFAERKFVASHVTDGLRIGGAAEFAGIDAPPNYQRSERLIEIAKKYLPDLNSANGSHWMGQRSTTPDSLPVIGASTRNPGLCFAFGHGHIGLTTAATTGQLVAQLVFAETPDIDLSPFSIDRFCSRGRNH
ncbi:MAG: NAD(P)/FAD-dependent oxidoreductase [bacterium]